MARIELDDGTIIDLNAVADTWEPGHDVGASLFDDAARGASDTVDKLYRTKSGAFVLISWNKERPQVERARRLNRVHACRWLLLNGRQVPDDLQALADALLD